MCGITGFSGNFSQELLVQMNAVISHRGPDDDGLFYDRDMQIGLAQRRLSIIDLSPLGHQPMWDALGKVVIVFNGEIYNYKELKNDLIKKGFTFKSACDTEVLLNLYLCYKEKMLEQLNGIFAFALWDTELRQIFIARDQLGVKPFYYTEHPDGFAFSSELKSLILIPSLNKSIDYEALNSYLCYLYSPSPKTMLKSIAKLEPGHALIVKEGRIQKKWQYYDLPYNKTINRTISVKEAIQQTEYMVRQAVRRQMIADVPVGAFLSGGLDSSSVVAFAREYASFNQKLQSFTIGFKDDTMQKEMLVNDLPYAQRVAKHFDVDLHTIFVGPEIIDHLEKMVYYLDEPQADTAPITTFLICKLARESGIKVLLSGAGGDDVFSGYRRHYALQSERYWSFLPESIRKNIGRLSRAIPVSNPINRRIAKAFKYAGFDGNERIASYFHWIEPEQQFSLYSSDVQDHLRNYPFSQPFVASLQHLPANVHPLNKMLYLEGKFFLSDHNLNYTDKMSMATGVEVRVPFLDIDLINFAAQLPVSMKQRGHTGKWILKKTMEKYLPRNIIYRPKCGFGTSLRYWIKNQLSDHVDELLSQSSIKNRGIFNYNAIKQMRDADKLGKIDAAYSILSLMCIEIWCRLFIDNHTPQIFTSHQ